MNVAVVLAVVPPVGVSVGAVRIVTTGGVRSPVVHVWTTGVWSTLPTGPFARTWNSCSPCATGYVWPEVHGWNVVLSSVHSNVASGLSDENVNVAVGLSVSLRAGGSAPKSVVAGASSITHLNSAGEASGCSAGSTARTRKMCSPSGRPSYSIGISHSSNGSPSSEHSNSARFGVGPMASKRNV